jgi:hypothetical protein
MQKAIECLRQRTLPTQLIYHLVKKRIYLEGAKPFKEGQKKTLDKFEIIRKLETIQLTNIKTNFKLQFQ